MKASLKFLLPVLLTLVLYPWQIHGYINGLDEGTFMAIAQALHSGKTLYREVWFQYGPLLALPLKAAVTLQEPTLFSLRLYIWLANVMGLLCVYVVLLKLVRSFSLRLVASLAIWSIPLAAHTTTIPMSYRYGPPFLALFFWNDEHRRHRFWAGLAAGFCFFLSQEIATAVLVGGLVYFFCSSKRKILVSEYVAGVTAAFLLFGIFIVTQYGWGNYWKCTVQETAGLLAARRGFFSGNPLETAALLFPIVIAFTALVTSRKKPMIAGLAVFVLLSAIPAWGRTDRWHIYYCLTPAVVLAATLASAHGNRGLILVSLGLLGLTLPYVVMDTRRQRAGKDTLRVLDLPRSGGVRIPMGQANGYEYLAHFAAEHIAPNESLLMFPYDGALYFLADRDFASRFPLLIEALSSAQQKETVVAISSARDLQWIIWDRQNASFDGKSVEEKLQPVAETIRANFSSFASYGPFEFLKRKGGSYEAG